MALVAKLPFFVFLSDEIFISLYITSPNCLVDPILNSFFEILKISFSNNLIFLSNLTESDFKKFLSNFMPLISINAKILINGFSNIS